MGQPRALLVVAMALVACGGSGEMGRSERTVSHDSAGVTIVESVRPLLGSDEAWRISKEPVAIVSADGADPDRFPLDPATAFRNSKGEIVVADGHFNGSNAVLVFDSTGQFLRRFGRKGPGPCEFHQLWWVYPFVGDSLIAFDAADHAAVVFAPDEECVREVALPRHYVEPPPKTFAFDDSAVGVFEDGSVLVILGGVLDVAAGPGIVPYRHALLRVASSGEVLDSLGIFSQAQAGWTGKEQRLAPLTLTALMRTQGHDFYYATGPAYEVRVFGEDGVLRRIVRRPYDAKPITEELKQQYIDWVISTSPRNSQLVTVAARRKRLEEESIWPPQLPPFSALLVDSGGNLWVEDYRSFNSSYVPPHAPPTNWSVFRPDGVWLGDVEVPGRLLPTAIDRQHVVGLWRREDGSTEVRMYGLTRRS